MAPPRAVSLSRNWLYVVLGAYALGFLLFMPRVLVIGDEERYVSQAVAFSRGALSVPGWEIVHPPTRVVISDYPPGTSLLQTPFVRALGWRGAALASVLCLIVATLLTARLIEEAGYSPSFGLLVPAFAGSLFFGRVAMSDVPSAAIVALASWALWRAETRGWRWSVGAGLCAGLSLLFREPNAVLLGPLVIDVLVRGRASRSGVLIGGSIGVATRLALSKALFGSAFYVREAGYGFSLSSFSHSAPPFAAILLVLFPLGAALPFLYRGPRRRAMQSATIVYLLLFLFYEYDSIRENGLVKGFVLATRYVVPAVPLLAFMAADVYPRWFSWLSGTRYGGSMLRLAAGGIAGAAFLVHPLASRQEATPVAIVRDAYEHTSPTVPVITNPKATLKYLSPSYGPRRLILRSSLDSSSLRQFSAEFPGLDVVLLDRNDSEMFREDARENDEFLAFARQRCELSEVSETRPNSWARLRIFRAKSCR